MKNKIISTLLFLVIGFVVTLVANIVIGLIFPRESGLIDWSTVLITTVILMLLSIRTIGRTADRMEKEGFSGALKSLFTVENKK